jgi:putative flippase GtrA
MLKGGWRQRATGSQMLRYIVVGGLNTGFSYAIYAALVFAGLGYALANLLALMTGILISFKTQGRFVFNNSANRLLGRFILGWALIYLCTITLIGRIIAIGLDAYSAGALSLPFSIGLSFVVQKFFVFRKTTPRSTENSDA